MTENFIKIQWLIDIFVFALFLLSKLVYIFVYTYYQLSEIHWKKNCS